MTHNRMKSKFLFCMSLKLKLSVVALFALPIFEMLLSYLKPQGEEKMFRSFYF